LDGEGEVVGGVVIMRSGKRLVKHQRRAGKLEELKKSC